MMLSSSRLSRVSVPLLSLTKVNSLRTGLLPCLSWSRFTTPSCRYISTRSSLFSETTKDKPASETTIPQSSASSETNHTSTPSSATEPATATASTSTPSSSSVSSPPSDSSSNQQSSSQSQDKSSSEEAYSFKRDPRVHRAINFMLSGYIGYLLVKLGMFVFDRPEVVQVVLKAAEEDPLVQEKCGKPLRIFPTWTGSVKEEYAAVNIPCRGPKGEAIITCRAFHDVRTGGWKLFFLQASFDGLAQKHTLEIPVDLIPRPYVNPESEAIFRQKLAEYKAQVHEAHEQQGKKDGQPNPNGLQETPKTA